VQLWGVMAMRLASADAIPLDYAPYARAISTFINEVERRAPKSGLLADARTAAAELQQASEAFNTARATALAAGDRDALGRLNARLLRVERALLDPDGIPGRPWYRHQIYAPKFTYAPELLPGVAEALDANDAERATRQSARLAAALKRAAAALR
jgi:N-acetylated-alpha-linked acidic dipeptidase